MNCSLHLVLYSLKAKKNNRYIFLRKKDYLVRMLTLSYLVGTQSLKYLLFGPSQNLLPPWVTFVSRSPGVHTVGTPQAPHSCMGGSPAHGDGLGRSNTPWPIGTLPSKSRKWPLRWWLLILCPTDSRLLGCGCGHLPKVISWVVPGSQTLYHRAVRAEG